MKLLLLEPQGPERHPTVDALRKSGVGALYARSVKDADWIMKTHGKSLDAVVVHESAQAWMESQRSDGNHSKVAYILASQKMSHREFLKHQNGSHAANAYIPAPIQVAEVQAKLKKILKFSEQERTDVRQLEQFESSAPKSVSGISLEEVSGQLSSPVLPKSTIQFEAPDQTHARVYEEDDGRTKVIQLSPILESSPAPEVEMTPEVSFAEEQEGTRVIDLHSQVIRPQSVEEPTHSTPGREMSEPQDDIDFDDLKDLGLASHVSDRLMEPLVFPQHEAASPDQETLRKYLNLREQDISVMTGKLKAYQDRMHQLEGALQAERAQNLEFQQLTRLQEQRLETYDKEKEIEVAMVLKRSEELEIELRQKNERANALDARLRQAKTEIDRVKERIRLDIRRIRVREKELENQLEVLKKDSERLISARDEKVLELKRKLDVMEFNTELLQEQLAEEKHSAEILRQKLKDAAQAMRQAGGFLEEAS
jgi:hypothetical protein